MIGKALTDRDKLYEMGVQLKTLGLAIERMARDERYEPKRARTYLLLVLEKYKREASCIE